MRQALLMALLVGGLSGCTTRAAEPDPTLVAALVAVHLHDARQVMVAESTALNRAALLAPLGWDSTRLRAELRRLSQHPDDYAAVLAAVSDRLSTQLRTLPAEAIPTPGPAGQLPPP